MSLVDKVNFELISENTNSPYNGSKFEAYKKLGAKRKGKVSEALLSDLLTKMGHKVEMPTHSNHDRIIDGKEMELKTSTLNAPKFEVFSFLQLRPLQKVDGYLFTCILPNDIRIFEASKDVVLDLIDNYTMRPQQGGGLKGMSKEEFKALSIDEKLAHNDTYLWYATLEELEANCKEIV